MKNERLIKVITRKGGVVTASWDAELAEELKEQGIDVDAEMKKVLDEIANR